MAGLANTFDKMPSWEALILAVANSNQSHCQIARASGVPKRTLQRWLKGDTVPTIDEWANVISICGFSPISCMIIAAYGEKELINTEASVYFGKLIAQIVAAVGEAQTAGELALDPRAAKHDAQLLRSSWTDVQRKRDKFLEDQYGTNGGSTSSDRTIVRSSR